MRETPDTNPVSEERIPFRPHRKEVEVDYSLWINEPDCIQVEIFEGVFVDVTLWLEFDPREDTPQTEAFLEYSFDRRATEDLNLREIKFDNWDTINRFVEALKERHAISNGSNG